MAAERISQMTKPYESLGSLTDMFREQVRKTPNATAVVDNGGRKLVFGELDILTDNLAQMFILKYNVKVGDFVGIYMEKSLEYVAVYIAAMKAGASGVNCCFCSADSLVFSYAFRSRLLPTRGIVS